MGERRLIETVCDEKVHQNVKGSVQFDLASSSEFIAITRNFLLLQLSLYVTLGLMMIHIKLTLRSVHRQIGRSSGLELGRSRM